MTRHAAIGLALIFVLGGCGTATAPEPMNPPQADQAAPAVDRPAVTVFKTPD